MQANFPMRAVTVAVLFLVSASGYAGVLPSPSADLLVSKNSPATATAGSDVSFDVSVVNIGPDNADTVTLTDNIPAGMTFVSETHPAAFSCSTPAVGSGGTITCTAAVLVANDTANFSFVLEIPPGTPANTSFTNTASVSTTTFDPNDENNNASSTTSTPGTSADVGVSKSGPPSVPANSDVTYSITVSNFGPNPAQSVQLTDVLPGAMTFVSLNQNSGPAFVCTTPAGGSGGTVMCTLATLASGATANFTLVGNTANAADGTTFTNTANVASADDPNEENNSSSVDTTVSSADLSIVKSGNPTVTAGQDLAYTISITNGGPTDADNPRWSDILPPNTTFVSLLQLSGPLANCNLPPAGSNGTVACFFASLPPTAGASFTLTVHIAPITANGTVITNIADVTSDTSDPNTNNNSSSATTTVTGLPDLVVTKGATGSVIAGNNITYTVGISNNGTVAASTVLLSDALPANTTFVSVTQNGGPTFACTTPAPGANGTINCTNASFAPAAPATFTIVVKTASNASGTVSNTATASASNGDINPADNSATATTTLTSSADLAVTKSGPATALQNQDVTYNLSLTNNGPSDAASVTLSDPIPSQATFVSFAQNSGPLFTCSTPSPGGSGTVNCSLATMTSGATATFTLVVHTGAAVSGGMINTVTTGSATQDPTPGNNSASAGTNVLIADLQITKTASPSNVAAGSAVTWTITATNAGPDPATSVALSDVMPANSTFVSFNQLSGPSFSCTAPASGASSGTVACTAGSLAPGAVAVFSFVTNTNANAPTGPLTNTTTIAAASPLDPTPGNNSATATTTVALVDLAVTKTASAPPYGAGLPVTYTIAVSNSSTVPASNVTVTDVLPAGTTYVSATPSQGSCTGTTTVTCTLGTLAGGGSASIALTVNLPATTGPVTNTATATTSNGDGNPANNTASSTITVIPTNAIPASTPLTLLLLGCALAGIALLPRR
jgi:uncharacterized repeat protein (TIGR01451 family)